MKTYIVDLGLSEKASIINTEEPVSSTATTLNAALHGPQPSGASRSIYDKKQAQFHQYTVHDLLYDHLPSYNGGYIIIVDAGPWYNLIELDKKLQNKYGSALSKYIDIAKDFVYNSPKLAYQIEPGAVNVNSDNYNLRHMSQNLFSSESKITSVSITYLEEHNKVEFSHYLWIEIMEDLKKGFIKLPDEYKAKDTDIFYPVVYYGQIWAYSFDPLTLRPRELVKYTGVYPTNTNLSDSFGQRGQNNHYMKNISYNVVDTDRTVFPHTKKQSPGDDFQEFYDESALFREFIDTCGEYNILT